MAHPNRYYDLLSPFSQSAFERHCIVSIIDCFDGLDSARKKVFEEDCQFAAGGSKNGGLFRNETSIRVRLVWRLSCVEVPWLA